MANDLAEIKKRIFEEDKIGDLFESIGCQSISFEQGGTLITAQLPENFDSKNTRAVQCRVNEGLWCNIRNRSDFNGDIFNLISYLKFGERDDDLQENLNQAKIFICDLFNWQDLLDSKHEKKVDLLSAIKNMRYRGYKRKFVNPNKIINENLLDNFINLPILTWIEEGISYQTQLDYGIGFDMMTKRITIPIRNRFGQLVGVKGRLLRDSDVSDMSPKYMYISKCNQSQEWFNLYIAISSIKKTKEVIIVEGEKSCMKFYDNGIYNVVGIGSSDVSDVQRDIIYSFGKDINIVLAYDNDKKIEEIQDVAEKFDKRSVQMIFDRDKLLSEKCAPIDCGIEIWNKLYDEYKYDLY